MVGFVMETITEISCEDGAKVMIICGGASGAIWRAWSGGGGGLSGGYTRNGRIGLCIYQKTDYLCDFCAIAGSGNNRQKSTGNYFLLTDLTFACTLVLDVNTNNLCPDNDDQSWYPPTVSRKFTSNKMLMKMNKIARGRCAIDYIIQFRIIW